MLKAIREFFDTRLGARPAGADAGRHRVELATAALLVEMARIDASTTADEHAAVLHAVRERLALSADEATELVRLAEEEVRQATDYFQFTSLIDRHFDQDDKIRIVELMWRIAYADAQISAHERHLMRKIADLLHVLPGEHAAARERARLAAGAAE